MDPISSALTVIDLIERVWNVTVLIRRIYKEAEEYPQEAKVIQEKFDHELLFIAAFRDLFNDGTGYLSPQELERLPRSGCLILIDVENIFSRLQITLASYTAFIEKHDVLRSIALKGNSISGGESSQSADVEETKQWEALKNKMKNWRSRTLGLRYEYALFDKKAIVELLEHYAEWNERLRQTMAFLFIIKPHDSVASAKVPALGMQAFARWQELIGAPIPSEFTQLQGELVDLDEDSVAGAGPTQVGKSFIVANYDDGSFFPRQVIVECRRYSQNLVKAIEDGEEDEISRLKEPLLSLSWMLHSASNTDQEASETIPVSYKSMKVLQCEGYLDEPDENRAFLIYQFPPSTSRSEQELRTLHALINSTKGDKPTPKPSLNERFNLAYNLANTLLSIHASNWLHKNIWPYSIAIFTNTVSSGKHTLVPYIAGWESARTTTTTSLLKETIDPEQLMYRHPDRYPDRQGKTRKVFRAQHDIYALGVVLLEIGQWRTISSINQFAKGIDNARTSGKIPNGEFIKTQLISRASDGTLASEMGQEYAKAVVRCLETSFDVSGDDNNETALQRGFRELVVETIREGVSL